MAVPSSGQHTPLTALSTSPPPTIAPTPAGPPKLRAEPDISAYASADTASSPSSTRSITSTDPACAFAPVRLAAARLSSGAASEVAAETRLLLALSQPKCTVGRPPARHNNGLSAVAATYVAQFTPWPHGADPEVLLQGKGQQRAGIGTHHTACEHATKAGRGQPSAVARPPPARGRWAGVGAGSHLVILEQQREPRAGRERQHRESHRRLLANHDG